MIAVLIILISYTAGSDYEEVNTLLTFSQGSECFDIVILDDSIFEGEENFTLTLQSANATNATIASINTVITIRDNDGELI